jgi:hypothetical protein
VLQRIVCRELLGHKLRHGNLQYDCDILETTVP